MRGLFVLKVVQLVGGKIQEPWRLMKDACGCKVPDRATWPPIDAEPGRNQAFSREALAFEPHPGAEIPFAALENLIDVTCITRFLPT